MARDPYPSETQDRFLLRMPNGMRDRLKAEAEANKRSMNAEIVERLEATFAPKSPVFDDEKVARLMRIASESSAMRTLAEITATMVVAAADDEKLISPLQVLSDLLASTNERFRREDRGEDPGPQPIDVAKARAEEILKRRDQAESIKILDNKKRRA